MVFLQHRLYPLSLCCPRTRQVWSSSSQLQGDPTVTAARQRTEVPGMASDGDDPFGNEQRETEEMMTVPSGNLVQGTEKSSLLRGI